MHLEELEGSVLTCCNAEQLLPLLHINLRDHSIQPAAESWKHLFYRQGWWQWCFRSLTWILCKCTHDSQGNIKESKPINILPHPSLTKTWHWTLISFLKYSFLNTIAMMISSLVLVILLRIFNGCKVTHPLHCKLFTSTFLYVFYHLWDLTSPRTKDTSLPLTAWHSACTTQESKMPKTACTADGDDRQVVLHSQNSYNNKGHFYPSHAPF